MARLRTNVLKWGNKYDGPNDYKHNRRGASEDAFWDEDEPVDYRKVKKHVKKTAGCPGNDGKSHVWVWIPYSWNPSRYEVKVCCGCEKPARRGFRVRPN